MSTPFDGEVTAAQNLVLDRQLLEAAGPACRVAVLADRSLSRGIGTPLDPVGARARAEGLAVVSRSSGGSWLYHAPGDIVWTVVLPRKDRRVGRAFTRDYARLGAAVVETLREWNMPAAWSAALGLSPAYCLLGGQGEVLLQDNRALGGAAQHLTKSALLHHGVIPYRIDRSLVHRLFDVPAEVTDSRLTSLEECGLTAPPAEFGKDLATRLLHQVKS